VSNSAHDGCVLSRVVRTAALVVAAGVVALANSGAAAAEPPAEPCSPAAMMRAQADMMTQLANFLITHPDVANADDPANAAAALQMTAALRNIQADMAETCGLSIDQSLMPPP